MLDFSQFGGVLETDPDGKVVTGSGGEPVWNFGRIEQPDAVQIVEGKLVQAGHPVGLYDVAPHLKGIGEDKTVILHHLVREIAALGGKFLKSQKQPRGTCVSRGAKRIADLCMGLAIRFGSPSVFDYLSHAYIYGTCREKGGALGGNPNNPRDDGAVGAWAAWSVANDGCLRNSDVQDDDNDDTLACKWGARGVPADIKQLGRVHVIEKVVPIRSVEEARDWICSGIGGVTVASGVGYEGQRDSRGVIRRRGGWSHQMCYTGWRHDIRALLQDQSWGPDMPGGPLGDIEIPSYSWWTLADDAAVQIGQRDCFGFAWLRSWEAQNVTYRP